MQKNFHKSLTKEDMHHHVVKLKLFSNHARNVANKNKNGINVHKKCSIFCHVKGCLKYFKQMTN